MTTIELLLTPEQAAVLLKLVKVGARQAGREAWGRRYKGKDLSKAIQFNQHALVVLAVINAQIAMQR